MDGGVDPSFDWERGTTQSLHWEGGNSGHVRYSGDYLHKLISLSPWRRGWHSLVSGAQLWCTYSSPHWLSQDSLSSRKGTPLRLEQTVKWYNKVLRQLLIGHWSFEKLNFLQSYHQLTLAGDFQLLFNKWDKEVMQLMLALEKCCNKFWDGSIDFSPVTGIWIHHLKAYRWVQWFHENKVAHGGNLFWTCRRLNILSPFALTSTQVLLNVNECMMQLDDLKKDAPKLWNVHLRECLSSAWVREDTASVTAIQKILCVESIRCRWRLVQRAAT